MGYTVRLLQCSTLLAPPRRYLQIRVVLRCPLQVATNQLASLLEQLASRNGSSRPRHHQVLLSDETASKAEEEVGLFSKIGTT